MCLYTRIFESKSESEKLPQEELMCANLQFQLSNTCGREGELEKKRVVRNVLFWCIILRSKMLRLNFFACSSIAGCG